MQDAFHCDLAEAAAFATSLAGARCGGCGGDKLSIFYAQAPQPSVGATLYGDARSAMAAPRGAVDLALCEDCGLIHNLHFEAQRRPAEALQAAPEGPIRLEAVVEPQRFLAAVRTYLAEQGGDVVQFQAPDAKAALSRGAFEEIHYARYAYYTPGAMARTLRRAGFAVERLETDSQGLLTATARVNGRRAPLGAEEDVAALKELTSEFPRRAAARMAAWRAELLGAADRPVALWGATARTSAFFTALGVRRAAPFVVDADPRKQGAYLAGFETPILAPEALEAHAPALVVAVEADGEAQARKRLKPLGVQTKLLGLSAY